MDVTTILIGIAAFIISAVVIYAISAFSMREKTFEEVIEEQRRRQEEEREKIKAEKKAEREQTKKKFRKGKQDKSKDKNVPVVEPDVQAEPKMVNLEIDPEIIEPTETLGLTSSVRNRNKKEKPSKSILHNKEEVTPVSEKTVEAYHKPSVPKDELELKKVHEKIVVEKIEKVHASPTAAQVKEKKIKGSAETKENLPPMKYDKEEAKSSKPLNQAKLKSEDDRRMNKSKSSAEDSQLNGTRVISYVKTAKLSDDEVQNLIDILLNKQGLTPSGPIMTDDSWNKKSQKGDPVFALKKQLEEKERILYEEQKSAQSANARVKEIRNELISEKTKHSAFEKQMHDKLQRQQAELDALQDRMRKTHEQYTTERKTLQAKLTQQEQGGDKASLQKLSDENKILQESLTTKAKENSTLADKLKIMEKDYANGMSKLQSAEAAKKTSESKLHASESKIKKLEANQMEVDALVSQRVEEVAQELRKSDARNQTLGHDLQNATGALSAATGEVSTLKAKLEELEKHLTQSGEAESKLQNSERKRSDLEGNVKNLEKQLTDVSRRLTDKDTEIKTLQQEKQNLTAENETITEKLQSAPAPNGDIHEDNEKLLTEKTKEIVELSSNLEAQTKAVTSLQSQLETRQMEVSDLKQQLSQQKEKNNELRAKNWKAMEALEKTEKSSAQKVDRALKSARESSSSMATEIETYDKAVFQRMFPDIQVGDKLPHKEWVASMEKQASKKLSNTDHQNQIKKLEDEKKLLQKQISEQNNSVQELNLRAEKIKVLEGENVKLKSSQSSQKDSSKYTELEADNARLKREVEKYQSIVSETENKLCQLEKSIDKEEKKWQEKLKAALSTASQATSLDKTKDDLKSVVSKQEEQVAEYRRVLALTEERLQKLGDRVASEEKVWQDKLSQSQKDLTKTQNELDSLKHQLQQSDGNQEDLSDLGFAYRCVEKSLTNIVDEMQVKIEDLESRLTESEEKIVYMTQEKEKVVSEVNKELEAERKKNKDLSLNVVKLNGIIKTGHDALKQEQSIVKKLQEQLDSKSMASGISDIEESEQLRTKLKEQHKQLEREIATNKQLSERLATPSGENGTSV